MVSEKAERLHPDIFTKEEAAAYLRLESDRCLEAIEKNFHLASFKVGREVRYHRRDLDDCVARMFGKAGKEAVA